MVFEVEFRFEVDVVLTEPVVFDVEFRFEVEFAFKEVEFTGLAVVELEDNVVLLELLVVVTFLTLVLFVPDTVVFFPVAVELTGLVTFALVV